MRFFLTCTRYAKLGFPWTNDEASGHLLVEGHYLPPEADPPIAGFSISILIKNIQKKGTETLGRGTSHEDFSALCLSLKILIVVGSQLRVYGSSHTFDIEVKNISGPKLKNNGAKYIEGYLEFEVLGAPFLDMPPTVNEPAAHVAKVAIRCVIPRIEAKVDKMIKDRYLTGVVATWDNTTARQVSHAWTCTWAYICHLCIKHAHDIIMC